MTWPDGDQHRSGARSSTRRCRHSDLVGSTGQVLVTDEAFTGRERAESYTVSDKDGDESYSMTANDSYQSMVEAFAAAVRGEAEWPRPVVRSIEMLQLIERIRMQPVTDPEDLAATVSNPSHEFHAIASGVELHVLRWEPAGGVAPTCRSWMLDARARLQRSPVGRRRSSPRRASVTSSSPSTSAGTAARRSPTTATTSRTVPTTSRS